MQDRLRIAKETLKKYESEDSRRLMEIVPGDETWIHYDEPVRKAQSSSLTGKDQDGVRLPPLKKPKPDRFGKKIMYSIFYDGKGNVTQIIVSHGKTVTGNFYATECLSAVEKIYKDIQPSRACKGMRLLHDNARPHKTRQVKEK